jgi:hypothetical protein
LVLVVVNAHSRLAGVVRAVTGVTVVDAAEQENDRKVFSGRALPKPSASTPLTLAILVKETPPSVE